MKRTPHHDRSRRWRWTFAGFAPLLAPIGWFFSLLVSYMLVPRVCVTGSSMLLPLITVVALLFAVSTGGFFWRSWRAAGQARPDETGGIISRSRFLAVLSMFSSGLFFLVILAQGIPTVMVPPCQP